MDEQSSMVFGSAFQLKFLKILILFCLKLIFLMFLNCTNIKNNFNIFSSKKHLKNQLP